MRTAVMSSCELFLDIDNCKICIFRSSPEILSQNLGDRRKRSAIAIGRTRFNVIGNLSGSRTLEDTAHWRAIFTQGSSANNALWNSLGLFEKFTRKSHPDQAKGIEINAHVARFNTYANSEARQQPQQKKLCFSARKIPGHHLKNFRHSRNIVNGN